MTQVIYLMESEDEYFLEATGQVQNQKDTNHSATLTKWADVVGDDGGLRPGFLLATSSLTFWLTRWTTIHTLVKDSWPNFALSTACFLIKPVQILSKI